MSGKVEGSGCKVIICVGMHKEKGVSKMDRRQRCEIVGSATLERDVSDVGCISAVSDCGGCSRYAHIRSKDGYDMTLLTRHP